jgi:predicted nucleic acid-binding Zn ribbon protein
MVISTKICKECGKEFEPNNTNKLICSDKCRKERNRRKKLDYFHIHKIDRKKQRHEYYLKNKTQQTTKNRNWRKNNAEKFREITRKWRAKKDNEVMLIFGKTCSLCGSNPKKLKKRRLVLHEIHGKSHVTYNKYYKEHKEDFIPLCRKCHTVLHWLIDIAKIEPLEAIEVLRKLIQKTCCG